MKTVFFDDILPLYKCTATDTTRKVLTGVYLNPKEGEAVATDGHKICIIKNEAVKHIPNGIVLEMPFLTPSKNKYLHFVVDDELKIWFGLSEERDLPQADGADEITLGVFTDLQVANAIVGDYPNYRASISVRPAADSRRVGFDPSILKTITSVCTGERQVVLFFGEKETDMVQFESGDYFGGIMPVRIMERFNKDNE